uniref:Uncharacterized protein n=1 Tax=Avena sativa TaxID=4498 RepID=A0ACD5XPZ0_AVESA
MSSSSLASNYRWQRYGPVPLGRCPDCPRMAPLKRLITTSDENGNAGRELVKCESKAEPGQKLPKCRHFEWLDDYIKRIGTEDASLGLNLGARWSRWDRARWDQVRLHSNSWDQLRS